MNHDTLQTGSCLCNRIKYQFSTPPIASAHCHCTDCQKATGSGFATVFGLAQSDVTVEGQAHLGSYTLRADSGLDVTRQFCQHCGSPLFTLAENNPGFIWIKAGTLDHSDWLQPTDSCWTGSAAPWAEASTTTTHHTGNP